MIDKVIYTDERYRSHRVYWEKHIPTHGGGSSFHIYNSINKNLEQEKGALSEESAMVLAGLAGENSMARFVVFITTFSIFLKKYTGENYITLHTPKLSNDNHSFEDETVPVLLDMSPGYTLQQSLSDVKTSIKNSYLHQDFPLELIQVINDKNIYHSNILISASHLQDTSGLASNYDFIISIENGNPLSYTITYKQGAYPVEFVKQFCGQLDAIFKCLTQPTLKIVDIEILPAAEKEKLLQFNHLKLTYDHRTLVERIDNHASKNPASQAIVCEGNVLTYEELVRRSNQLAHYFVARGFNKQVPICLIMERSEDLVICLLSLLKLGIPYIPIDPKTPPGRISYYMRKAGADVLVKDLDMLIVGDEFQVLNFNELKNIVTGFPRESLVTKIHPGDIAYIMFTSGSTGNPKGVEVSYRSLMNSLEGLIHHGDLHGDMKYLVTASFGFDASVKQLFIPLALGAEAHLFTSMGEMVGLAEYIEKNEINTLHLVPAAWEKLLDVCERSKITLESLEYISSGGDHLDPSLRARLKKFFQGKRVFNLYGPTETCINVIGFDLNEDQYDQPIIGKPLPNVDVYIVDSDLKLSPIAGKGQIAIAGPNLANGYINDPLLTAQNFIDNPFLKGQKLYLTGDMGRWLPSGNVEFLGRMDEQVKIRGYRIEPAEIELNLSKHPAVKGCVVIAKPFFEGSKELIAFITAKAPITNTELRDYLEGMVPSYMIPAYFQFLDTFPLSGNGKVDKKALARRDVKPVQCKPYVAPTSPTEVQVSFIWQELLAVQQPLGIDADFFQIGGHSLKAIQLISHYERHFGVKITLKQVFDNTTIRCQAELIDRLDTEYKDAISKIPRQSLYPISYGQRRLWILGQIEEISKAYHVPFAIDILESIDVKYFELAFKTVISRYESLRTVFVKLENGDICQEVTMPSDECSLQLFDFSDRPGLSIDEAISKDMEVPFDLENGPLLRARLYKVSRKHYVFYVNMHHIITDGASMNILRREILNHYWQLSNGHQVQKMDQALQYKDYAWWQLQQLQEGVLKEARSYWLDQLAGELPLLHLPTDYKRPTSKSFKGSNYSIDLDKYIVASLKDYCQKKGGSLYMGLLTILKGLIYRYSGQQDVIVGCPVAGRSHTDLSEQVGFFVNVLALRTPVSGKDSLDQLFQKVRDTAINGFEHQMYPFDRLVEDLEIQRDQGRNPLFDVAMTFERSEGNDFQSLKTAVRPLNHDTAKLDLSFDFRLDDDNLKLEIEYSTDLFEASTIRRIAGHFSNFLQNTLNSPGRSIQELNYLSQEEIDQQLFDFNSTDDPGSLGYNLVGLFQDQVEKWRGRLAIEFEGKTWTYGELDAVTNKLANFLLSQYNIEGENLVAIEVDRSDWMIISILGILKTGAAYVPIDPNYPPGRRQYILEDSSCILNIDYHLLSTFKTLMHEYSDELNRNNPSPDNLAYVLYTSGSTGYPKGVMIEHGSIANTLISQIKAYQLNQNSRGLQFLSFSFDPSIFEVFLILLAGGQLHILPDRIKNTPSHFEAFIQSKKITFANIPPSWLSQLNKKNLSSIHTLVTGGEDVNVSDCSEFLKYGNYSNSYGPTETSICATNEILDKETKLVGKVSIGSPISNTQVYILNESNNLEAIGVAGEICVGGAGLARGYLNKETMTKQSFIHHPFRRNQTLYKTGDLGKWLSNGKLEFLGRIDDQVKLRGHRVEIKEIEHALLTIPGIKDCLVLVKKDELARTDLIAYVISETPVSKGLMREKLQNALPAYMVPSHYVLLDEFPVTANGKVDKKLLLEQYGDLKTLPPGIPYKPPGSLAEKALVQALEEVLHKNHISVLDNFFDLGGDSIKSILVVSKLRELGYSLKVPDILKTPAISLLATKLMPITRVISQAVPGGKVPLSPIQHWYLTLDEEPKHHFNQSVLLRYEGRLSLEHTKRSFAQLVLHHDSLRMRFKKELDQWHQYYAPAEEEHFKIEEFHLEDPIITALRRVGNKLQEGLNITDGPLIRAGLFHAGEESYLQLVVHHLVVDGLSWRILLEDFATLYRHYSEGASIRLKDKTSSFQYWMEAQLAYAEGDKIASEMRYWQAAVSKPTDELPLDQPGGSNTYSDLEVESFKLGEGQTQQFQEDIHRSYGTGPNDVLLGALTRSIGNVFGISSVQVGLEGHGREELEKEVDVSRTIGWFTTSYPVALKCSGDSIDHLIETKEQLRRIPNKGIGYGVLRYLNGKENLKAHPPVIFNYLGDFGYSLTNDHIGSRFAYSDHYHGDNISKRHPRQSVLDVSGIIVSGILQISIGYSRSQYERSTIVKLCQVYRRTLKALVAKLSEKTTRTLTPSDVTSSSINKAILDSLQDRYNLEDLYGLSPLQSGLYYHWLSNPGSKAYTVQLSYKMTAHLEEEWLRKSFKGLLSRHGILRSVYVSASGAGTLQIVQRSEDRGFHYKDLSGQPSHIQCSIIDEYKANDRLTGFDLAEGPLIRLAVFCLGTDDYEFIWSNHHILMDGWCLSILNRDFYTMYENCEPGKRKMVLPPARQYSDYIKWLETVDQPRSMSYWESYLSGYERTAIIPGYKANLLPYRKQTHTLELGTVLSDQLMDKAKQFKVTPNILFQTVWGVLLGSYNNRPDVVFGSVVSGRPGELEGVEQMVGLFINTIPVRIKYSLDQSFRSLLEQVQLDTVSTVVHHHTQLADIQSGCFDGQELLNHILVFENYPLSHEITSQVNSVDIDSVNLQVSEVEGIEQTHYDFNLVIVPGASIKIKFEYNEAKYSPGIIDSISGHFRNLLDIFLTDPGISIGDADYLDKAEKEQLLKSFNNTRVPVDAGKTILDLFNDQVEKTPVAIAIEFEGRKWSYSELDTLSNQFSNYLHSTYILETEDLVSILLDRSDWLVITILGILKAGCAYVPIDPSYPEERIHHIKTDSRCKGCVDKTRLEEFKAKQNKYNISPPKISLNPSNMAYTIYTSGSTGIPKGVMIEHRSLVNLCSWHNRVFGVDSSSKATLYSQVGFDASTWEIWPYLVTGGTLYPIPGSIRLDLDQLYEYLEVHKITHAFLPTAVCEQLVDREAGPLSDMYLLTGGDKLNKKSIGNWNVVNNYGPTENTVVATSIAIPRDERMESLPIGYPIDNVEAYVFNERLQLQPIGVEGELYLGGASLARGYLHNESLTAEKFVPHPFHEGQRLYRTGDWVCWQEDGTLLFKGRKDNQVQVRGHRVELAEIEVALGSMSNIKKAVVIQVDEIGAPKQLIAYYTSSHEISRNEIKDYLRDKLPSYMIPFMFVRTASFSTNANGKLDFSQLPKIDIEAMRNAEFLPPVNETQKILVKCFEETLEVTPVGIEDNFFEMGGNSIKAIQLFRSIEVHFAGKIKIGDLYSYPTVAELANYLTQEEVGNQEDSQIEDFVL